MSIPRFTPGELTAPQAAALNELARVKEQFDRLTVAPPLSLTRPAGIPAIRFDPSALTGDLLAEITAVSGSTPPVHTAKRKTRDTSNNVVDYSPAQVFTQVLNPHETAYPVGTLIELVAIPDWPGWYWGFAFDGGNLPSGLPCEPHGWLLDRQALIDTNKYFDVQIFAGSGRCACIIDQGRNPDTFPYPWQARYDATAATWLLMEKMATCCDDCVQLKLDVDETTGKMTGQLVGSTACDDGNPFTYDLVEMCSGRGFAVFGAAGVKLCNTVLDPNCIDDKCDNSFTILATCDCCDAANQTCELCCACSAPPFILFQLSGFSGANAFLNTLWVLPYTTDCTWGLVCNGVTFAYTIELSGSDTVITLVIGGVATYTLTIAGENRIYCAVNRTLARTSGDAGTTPATVTAEPWTCTALTAGCFPQDETGSTIYFQFHDCTFDAACLNGLIVPLTYGVGTGSCAGAGISTWNGTFTDCTNGATPGYICLGCHDGADSSCPWVVAIDFLDHGCAGPMGIVSTTCDPFTMEVLFVNTCFFGQIHGRITLTSP